MKLLVLIKIQLTYEQKYEGKIACIKSLDLWIGSENCKKINEQIRTALRMDYIFVTVEMV